MFKDIVFVVFYSFYFGVKLFVVKGEDIDGVGGIFYLYRR